MNLFKNFGEKLSYKDILEIDGAFSLCHINYGKSPVFNGTYGKSLATISRKDSFSNKDNIKNVIDNLENFNGTEKNFKMNDRIILWKSYWLEYINAFDKLTEILPNSIVTVFIGRQAVEIGFKYLLLKKTKQVIKEHNLQVLSNSFFLEYEINDDYMDYVDVFCSKFSKYIEGENSEYFRYPEYKENNYFAGNRTDMKWLSYNLALIILKLIHFDNLDYEI